MVIVKPDKTDDNDSLVEKVTTGPSCCPLIAVAPGPLTLVTPARIIRDGHTMDWPEDCYGKPARFYRFGSGPRVGTRNVHAMSGRVA